MKTLGIDLSANPAKTGACEIDWELRTAQMIHRPVTDDRLVEAIGAADMTGIDIPLGWPDAFVTAVVAHHNGHPWPPVATAPPADREPLRFRLTDLVAMADGARPLSVSTDRIGVAAMRGARLQHLLAEAGLRIDRSGTAGCIAEVYPAAALRRWALASSGYKGGPNAAICRTLAADVAGRCGPITSAVTSCLEGCDDDTLMRSCAPWSPGRSFSVGPPGQGMTRWRWLGAKAGSTYQLRPSTTSSPSTRSAARTRQRLVGTVTMPVTSSMGIGG